jgi:hypothetical protein
MALSKISMRLLPALLLWSCSPRTPPPTPTPPPPQKNIFEPLTRDLDRARDVQNSVDQHAAATRDSVDSAERGDPP